MMAYGVLMISSAGKCRKLKTLLMTPFFSSNVCHASVRRRKFIHIGRIKTSTIKLVWFTCFWLRIIASGYARIKQIAVLKNDRRMDMPSAFRFSGVVICARLENVKLPSSLVNA